MYKSSLRHIHDPVLSSLKMKGIRLSFSVHCYPTTPPPPTRAPTRACVKRMKDNEMRHVIHYTRNSSGQCPRRDVTVRYGTAYKVIRTIPQRKDIYMSKFEH
jgi:hypothetical protein